MALSTRFRQAAFLFVMGVLLMGALLAPTVAQASEDVMVDGAGAGYWYTVQPGDSWYKLADRFNVSVHELWRANPGHIHRFFWLRTGHRIWIPVAVACPGDYSGYPTAISDFLNAEKATVGGLQSWLTGCGVLTVDLGSVAEYALRDVTESDVVVAIHNLAAGLVVPPGTLLVYHGSSGVYDLVYQADGEGRVEVLAVADLNVDGRREIAWTDTNCGAHTCFGTLFVDQWDGESYRDWIIGMPNMAYPEYTVTDSLPQFPAQEIVAHGGVIGSVGAGPQRAWTETYFSLAGQPYRLISKEYDDSSCYYHNLLDANQIYNLADSAFSSYQPAIDAYNALPADGSLEACAFADFPDELATLRDFTRFRLVVAHTAEGHSSEAADARSQINDTAIAGAADAFLTEYGSSSDLAAACAAVTTYASANPASWEYLADWGYANPTFTAEWLCAGTASISGTVWREICTVPEGGALPPGPGCVDVGGGVYQANGIYEAGESTIPDVTITLMDGQCSDPGMSQIGITATDGLGDYTFSDLTAGDYCVVIDMGNGDNGNILIPGQWTHPGPGDGSGTVRADVTLQPGQEAQDVTFGWDYQFD